MSNFRKKPVVVQAEQFNGWARIIGVPLLPIPEGIRELTLDEHARHGGDLVECVTCCEEMCSHAMVDTLEGAMLACPGDWIITGVKGERYPCKPDIFEATYEPVEG